MRFLQGAGVADEELNQTRRDCGIPPFPQKTRKGWGTPFSLRGKISNAIRMGHPPTGLGPDESSWWDNLKKRWSNFWKPAPQYGYKPTLYNLCPNNYRLLFNEGSPINPYYGRDTNNRGDPNVEAAYTAWVNAFNHKCEAAQQPGKVAVPFCDASVLGPNGPVATCSCCEICQKNGTK